MYDYWLTKNEVYSTDFYMSQLGLVAEHSVNLCYSLLVNEGLNTL